MQLQHSLVQTATAAGGTNTTALASTAFVQQEITTLIGGAPSTLNDLNELAAAINDDANYNSTLTTALATKLPKAGGTMTGNLNMGDNVKAQFGAGNDLQIYHDGSHSYIEDAGTGSIKIKVGDFRVENASGNNLIKGVGDVATLHHAGAEKLATTATGIDVTGSVVADGLTVDGNAQLNGDLTVFDGTGDPFVKLQTSEQQYVLRIDNSQSDVFQIRDTTNSANRLAIANNGDISFYEDTGCEPQN